VSVKPVPDGYHTVTPYLIVEDAPAVIAFLEKAFGAEVKKLARSPDGKIMNAEVRIGTSMVMLADAREGIPCQPTSLYVYVEDVDAVYTSAVAAGGVSTMEPTDMFYGDRHGGVQDTSGNNWWIATHIEDVPDAEIEARMKAFFDTQQG
jgi:uncharacterized glyoxalase superfamily protein PhnB